MTKTENTRRRNYRRIGLFSLGLFVTVFLFVFLAQRFGKLEDDTSAANLANFQAGYIISDYQMTDYNSMSEADIQNFLWSKGRCYNTNFSGVGTRVGHFSDSTPPTTWHVKDGHTVCLAEENMNGETAAHIIWQAAQDYKINPKVLIVLLQKETGVITDPIPNSWDYQRATGYGCPDTAACSEKYYGFKNQVRNAASLFRIVMDGNSSYYPIGNNNVRYSPDPACGSSVVYIKNLATSALYRYTPYQPNAGALAAGYGTAPCGAYGNRNFYAYFEDWFGNTTATNVVWEDMQTSRVMTVTKSTLVINARTNSVTTEWVNTGENYYFTKKTLMFWGGEQRICLQRRSDIGTDKCVLMERTEEFSLNNKITKMSEPEKYRITQWTCIVNLYTQLAECNKKTFNESDVVQAVATITIDKKEYLIQSGKLNTGYAILKARTKRTYDFENLGTVLMRLTSNNYKYDIGTKQKVQALTVSTTPIIKISEKIKINGEIYYRTAFDAARDNNYVIPGSALSSTIFEDFMYPRNMTMRVDSNSIDLTTGKTCKGYRQTDTRKYTKKINYNGEIYYQSEDEVGTTCAVKASALTESRYNFTQKDIKNNFVNFLYPRNLKMITGAYEIDVTDGKTCSNFLNTGDIRKYTTKIIINGEAFYRSEERTAEGSSCAVPSYRLVESY